MRGDLFAPGRLVCKQKRNCVFPKFTPSLLLLVFTPATDTKKVNSHRVKDECFRDWSIRRSYRSLELTP